MTSGLWISDQSVSESFRSYSSFQDLAYSPSSSQSSCSELERPRYATTLLSASLNSVTKNLWGGYRRELFINKSGTSFSPPYKSKRAVLFSRQVNFGLIACSVLADCWTAVYRSGDSVSEWVSSERHVTDDRGMATLGLSKVFILDKYFTELQKFWETEKKLQGEGQEQKIEK